MSLLSLIGGPLLGLVLGMTIRFVYRHVTRHQRALAHIAQLEESNADLDRQIAALSSEPSAAAIPTYVPTFAFAKDIAEDKPRQRERSWAPVVLDDDYFERKREVYRPPWHYSASVNPYYSGASVMPFQVLPPGWEFHQSRARDD